MTHQAKPLFVKNPMVADIVAELEEQGMKFGFSGTDSYAWYWQFNGQLKDEAKFLRVLARHMALGDFEEFKTHAKPMRRSEVIVCNNPKFTTGMIQINDTHKMINIWMHRAKKA